jgi:hypothetical protein
VRPTAEVREAARHPRGTRGSSVSDVVGSRAQSRRRAGRGGRGGRATALARRGSPIARPGREPHRGGRDPSPEQPGRPRVVAPGTPSDTADMFSRAHPRTAWAFPRRREQVERRPAPPRPRGRSRLHGAGVARSCHRTVGAGHDQPWRSYRPPRATAAGTGIRLRRAHIGRTLLAVRRHRQWRPRPAGMDVASRTTGWRAGAKVGRFVLASSTCAETAVSVYRRQQMEALARGPQ